jgi:hypothetical protein
MPDSVHCKDCDAVQTGQLIAAGWRYVDVVEGDDPANGWRCPKCFALWQALEDRLTEQQSLH